MRTHTTGLAETAVAAIFVTVTLLLAPPLLAAPGNDTAMDSLRIPYRVPEVDSDIAVDGVLDEDLWQNALVLELDYEVRPGENIPPPVRTEVLLAYSREYLYVGFRAFDPDPSAIRARITDRDRMYDDDWVAVILDTFNDERRCIEFFSNPLGVQGDAIETPEGSGQDWDAIWDSAGRITDQGYVTEMAIPFSSLRFQRTEGDQVWGFDAVRSYPRIVRHHIGAFPRDRNNNCYLCQAIKLVGFARAKPGRNFELDPTLSALLTQERDRFPEGDFVDRESRLDPGLTVRWGLTPNMTLNATVNPDFSQVEADAVQLDINTQFAIFYPEKRPFFLECADFFQTRLQTVDTRTLADPRWGLKVTGKEGVNTLGLFMVQDDITNMLFPGSQYSSRTSLDMHSTGSVLRFSRDLGGSSRLGVLLTDREGKDYYNRMGGVDGDVRITTKDRIWFQMLGSRTLYPQQTASDFGQDLEAMKGAAADIFYLRDTRSLDWYVGYREVQDDFRADLGYMPQVDFRYMDAGWGHTWNNEPDQWYNMLNFGSGYELEEDHGGNLLQRAFTYWFNYAGPLDAHLDLDGRFGRRTYGGREFDDTHVHFDTALNPSGSIFLGPCTFVGDQIDYDNVRPGSRVRFKPWLEYKLGRNIALELAHTFERLNVNEWRLFTARVTELKTVCQFDKRTFLRVILQYSDYAYNPELYAPDSGVNPEEEFLFSQILFSYKINPQTVLFVGYSDNHEGYRDIKLTQADRAFFVKIGYAWVL
ncbi:MAG: carbohydrate binding family 9 domain-containing protein [Candidatus Eiseniibacteriota bacterium]|nr:MAG: carbohydrate binding family 9 domain-containing protein [Candidatus Eisenbacteria bacterium]